MPVHLFFCWAFVTCQWNVPWFITEWVTSQGNQPLNGPLWSRLIYLACGRPRNFSLRPKEKTPARRGFSLAWLLAFTMSFASLVSRVAGLFYKFQEKPLHRAACGFIEHAPDDIKYSNYTTDKRRERLRKRLKPRKTEEKPLLVGWKKKIGAY